MRPETRYAKSDGVHIAYQVVGDGDRDLVLVPGWVSHVEHYWELPAMERFLRRLGRFSRLITFDKRGTGLSDRVSPSELPTYEQRVSDVEAVMDAAGCERAVLMGVSEGGCMSAQMAATRPERVEGLILYGAYARFLHGPDHPWRPTREEFDEVKRTYERKWGMPIGLNTFAPSVADDQAFRQWWGEALRVAASPGAALALLEMNAEDDVREVLPRIQVPTLVLHRTGDRLVDVRSGRFLADHIPQAVLVELPGEDHVWHIGDSDAILDEVEEFMTGSRSAREPERALRTVLFTDIAGSTRTAARIGDQRWRDLLEAHKARVRRELARRGGQEINTTGDGFVATFESPAAAIESARAIRDAMPELGTQVRVGLHTGECELIGDDVGGIAVHIAARVMANASAGEVLVSGTVKDLVVGSGLSFEPRGAHELKGVPGEWPLFALA